MQVIKPNDIPFTDGTFARSTTGTYVEEGLVKTAAINIPRFQFGALLLEESRTNLVPNSEVYTAGLNVTVTSNSTTNPRGATTADLVLETTATGEHYTNNLALAVTAGQPYSFYTFIKKHTAGTDRAFHLRVLTGTTLAVTFDPTAKVWLGTEPSGSAGYLSRGYEELGDGWIKVWVSFTAQSTTTTTFRNQLATTAGAISYTGSSTSGLVFGGSQVELGAKPSSYILTSGSAVTRSADVITGSNLVYTTATDSTSIWVSSATYSLGAKVRTLGKVYESLQNSNLNNPPATSPTFWLYLYPDNQHASLDNVISTASTATESLTFIVKPGKLDSVALINVDSPVVEVSVIDPATGDVIFKSTLGLTGAEVYDWYQYFFFDPVSKRTQIILGGINNTFANAVVAIRLLGAAATTVSIGSSIFGNTTKLGGTQYGATSGIVDYSKKETDEFGTITFVERAFSKRLSADIHFPNNQLNTVQRFLYSIRATPVVWVASDDPEFEEALVVYGFYRDFSSTIAYPTHTLCSLEIEGLT